MGTLSLSILADFVARQFPFDVEVYVENDGEDDLTLHVHGATLNELTYEIEQRKREFTVRGEIIIPYNVEIEAVDEDDARDQSDEIVQGYVDSIFPAAPHGHRGLTVYHPMDEIKRVDSI